MIKTPDMSEYVHRTTPYEHQRKEFEKSRDLSHYALFWEMGTGKSKPIIDTMAYLYMRKEIDGVVIVSDKGAYLNWHYEEIPKHMPTNVPVRSAYWTSYMTSKKRRELESIMIAVDDRLDILCVNIEALSSGKAVDVVRRFINNHYTMMIVDESTSIKNYKASRTENALKLGRMCDYRRIMTGTPITQAPLDVWSQCEFLKQNALGYPTFTSFRAQYADLMLMDIGRGKKFYKIKGYKNLEALHKSLSSISSRILKTECLDLPEKIYETLYVEATPEQRQMFNQLKSTAVIQIEQGLITATNALTAANKFQQISCGHLKMDDGRVIDIPNNRTSALIEQLQKIDGKVIIWCAYQRDVELILQAIAQAKVDGTLSGYPVDYYGKTVDQMRQDNLELFRKDPRCKWLVGTAATGGKGITLVESSHTIYYSNTYSLEDRLQSEDRNHRIGQRNNVVYIDMVIPGMIDQKIVTALKKKEDLAYQVLDMLREVLSGDLVHDQP